jgi:hypothetical protein
MLAAALEKMRGVPKKQPDEMGVYRVFATMQKIKIHCKNKHYYFAEQTIWHVE